MKKNLSNVLLFILGVLVSVTLATSVSKKENIVTLDEDNHITFSGPVNDKSVAEAQVRLSKISKELDDDDVIYLVIDSPGGSVTAGNLFIDFANSIPQKIKPICIFCASMGYHMLQSFDERIVYSSSTLMSHRAALGGLSGQIPGELDSRLNAIKAILFNMDSHVAKRIGTSLEDYRKLIHDELWLDGVNAVNTKHADRVAKIRCSKSLAAGVKTEEVDTMFGSVQVRMSKCPLISGFLGADFDKKSFRSEAEALAEVRKAKRKISLEY